jgi:hypothetical protein
MKAGKPVYAYNSLSLKRFTIVAKRPVLAGKATIGFQFANEGGGLGEGGTGTLFAMENKWLRDASNVPRL